MVFSRSVDYKKRISISKYYTVQIKISLVIAFTLTLSGQDSGDLLHVLVVGHAGLAVGPVLENRLHDGAHGEEGGFVWPP